MNGYRKQQSKILTKYGIPGDWNFELLGGSLPLYIVFLENTINI